MRAIRLSIRGWRAGSPPKVRIGAMALLCLFCLSPRVHGQSPPSAAQELLHAAAQSSQWLERYSSSTNVKYRAIVGDGPHQYTVGTNSIVQKYRDGDRLHIIIQLLGHLNQTGAYVARSSRRETIFAQDTRTYCWYPLNNPLTGTVQVARSPKRISAMRLVDDADSSTGCFLDGYVDGMGNILDIVERGDVSPTIRHEQLLGMDCHVIESRLPSGHATVWLAPSKGNVIIKYDLETSDPAGGSTEAQFEAASLQNVDGRIVIASGHSARIWTDPDTRAKWHETVEAQRTSLNLHPDFSDPNLFTTRAVPNGIRVVLDDMPNVGVDFIWYNGQPIAKVDPDLFSQLDTSVHKTIVGDVAQFTPVSAASESSVVDSFATRRVQQIWLLLGSAAAIALTGLLGIYIRKRGLHAN